MINKKLLTILIGLILISGVIALTIGDTFTQTEFNQTDFSEIDFGMEIINSYMNNDRLFIEFEYNTLEKQVDSNDYEVVTKNSRIPYYLGDYRDCRDTNTIDECNNQIIDFVYVKAEQFRNQEKVLLENQKTKDAVDEINAFDFKTLYINYDNYKVNKDYVIGNIFVYKNELYEIIQDHTSLANWIPSEVPSLYKVHVLSEDGEIRAWVQPIGASDAYNIGDKVTFEGNTYESLINANVWSPIVYSQGWLLIE